MSEDSEDAKRFRWLARHLKLVSTDAGNWTCWLELDTIPYRINPAERDPIKLLDELIARFP